MKENVKKDFQELIGYCQSFAEYLLKEQQEFYPFAAYLSPSGELCPVAIYEGDEFPLSENVMTSLEATLEKRKANQELLAYAIAYDCKVTNQDFPESIDAIAVRVVHKEDERQVNYYFPYRVQETGVEILEGWGEYV
jgi:hypothetical protein